MFRSFALFFAMGYRYVTLTTALTVVTSVAQWLVIEWLPKVTTEAHWRDVVDDLCHAATLHAQRMLTEESTPILAPR